MDGAQRFLEMSWESSPLPCKNKRNSFLNSSKWLDGRVDEQAGGRTGGVPRVQLPSLNQMLHLRQRCPGLGIFRLYRLLRHRVHRIGIRHVAICMARPRANTVCLDLPASGFGKVWALLVRTCFNHTPWSKPTAWSRPTTLTIVRTSLWGGTHLMV